MKSPQDTFGNLSDEVKDNLLSKGNLSRYEYDLYHEEDNIVGKVIQVKKIGNAKKGEKWKIFADNKNVLTIDGVKLTSKERSFLYTPEGIGFLIKQFKLGIPSLNALKKSLKSSLEAQ